MNVKQMKNRNSLRHIHKKTPAEFSPQGSVNFRFLGSIHFDEGAFSSVVNRRNRGIRLEVVARLLGHKTTKLTTHYAKLLDKNIIDEVGSAFGKV